jgi:hypothetical protein
VTTTYHLGKRHFSKIRSFLLKAKHGESLSIKNSNNDIDGLKEKLGREYTG